MDTNGYSLGHFSVNMGEDRFVAVAPPADNLTKASVYSLWTLTMKKSRHAKFYTGCLNITAIEGGFRRGAYWSLWGMILPIGNLPILMSWPDGFASTSIDDYHKVTAPSMKWGFYHEQ